MSSPWSSEDRALILAWRSYKATLCSGCGQPKERAWHPDNDGWFEVEDGPVCHACTAMKAHHHPDPTKPVEPAAFPYVVDTRDYAANPLPPWPAD